MGSGPRISREEIIRLSDLGWSSHAIASALGCAPRTVQRVRALHGWAGDIPSVKGGKAYGYEPSGFERRKTRPSGLARFERKSPDEVAELRRRFTEVAK